MKRFLACLAVALLAGFAVGDAQTDAFALPASTAT
jgi:hypothetical protein